jgi:D-alanyl-D-alanine carboxypeptidase
MRFAAGSKWEYSNTNYVLLGLLVEKLYVRPLGEVIREEFAEPLGLTHTRSCEDAPGANGQARGYVLKDERLHARPYRHASHGFGAGDLCSTVADLAKWNRALHGGRVVDETSYTLMTTPQGAAMAGNYGFGLLVTSTPGSRVIFHNGGMSGFISRNTWFPEHSMSVVVLVNTSPARQEETLARDLARVALGRPVEIVHPQTTAVDAATLRRYAGRYVIQVPGRPLAVRLWVDRGKLMAQAEGQTAFELRPAGEHTFGAAVDPTMKFTFVVREDVVTGLLFQQGGRTFETVKKD